LFVFNLYLWDLISEKLLYNTLAIITKPKNTMKLFDLNTVFNFGKHKGKTLKEVIEMEYGGITLDGEKIITMSESPSYLNWCAINVNYFVLSKKTIEEIKKKSISFLFFR